MTGKPPHGHQLDAWRGDFGDAYTERNAPTESIIEARVTMWKRILDALGDDPPERILEIGANIGLNLRALRRLTDARLIAIEPNGGGARETDCRRGRTGGEHP